MYLCIRKEWLKSNKVFYYVRIEVSGVAALSEVRMESYCNLIKLAHVF